MVLFVFESASDSQQALCNRMGFYERILITAIYAYICTRTSS